MSRIVTHICNRKLVNAVAGKLRRLRNARALAAVLVIALLVTSLPASAGTTSRARAVTRYQRSFASQLYSDFGTTMASLASWVRGYVRPQPAVAAQPYVPIAAYLNPAPPFISEPTNLSVTSAAATAISLSWTPPSGGADHYQVERTESISGPFFFVANASGTTYNDTSVTNLHAYLYRVRAVSAVGAISLPSNMALGTAITFEFSVLANQLIKAQHYHDVRTAIDKVRGVAGMSGYAWTRANLAGLTVNASDTTEMRSALDAALTALSIPVTAYTDPTLTVGVTLVKATHLEQLQSRSTRGQSTSSGPADSDSSSARLDPLNETGGGGENPLSRNFNWNLPLVSLPGRAGLDLSLTLSYNSLVWTKVGTSAISFDKDNGFPGPGFRVGFPVIQPLYFNSEVGKNAFLLIGSDGTHTELRQVNTSALYESADSSHMLLDSNGMILSLTDGTQLTYELRGGEYKCAKIKDRNGNYITVTHNAAGRVDTVTDTLGRVLTFNYDGTGLLTSITQQWNQTTSPVTHYWARFEYADKLVDTNFPGLTIFGPADGTSIKTLSRVKLADDSYFDFSYSTWGQVYKISSYAPDTHLLNYRFYNLPQTAGSGLEHSDCPRFTERRDWAQYWNGDTDDTTSSSEEALTTFAVPVSDTWTMPGATSSVSGVRAQVTAPDGTSNKIYYIGAPGWQRGLIALVDTYASGNPVAVRRAMTTWTQDTTTVSYPLNPRVTATNIYDDSGNRARTDATYQQFTFTNGTSCQLPQDIYEYANDEIPPNPPTMLRSTRITYEMSATYTDRHIFGLVSFKQIYEGNVNTTGVLKSKVGFLYDESLSIDGTNMPIQHDGQNYPPSLVAGRANLTSVKSYDVTNSNVITTTKLKYNRAGSVISSKDALDHEVTVSYTDSFSDGVTTRNTFAYSKIVTDPDNNPVTSTYNFDFGAVTRTQTPPTNVPATLPGPEKSFSYDAIGRLQQETNLVNNGYRRFEYPTSNIRSDVYATVQDGLGEAHSFQISDGLGRVVATAEDNPGSVGLFSGQKTIYDVMGRAFKVSNKTETSASGAPSQWTTAGDDAAAGWVYTQQTYDWKGRPLVTTNQDLTTRTASYSGCGCAGGEVVTLTDEGTVVGGVAHKRQTKTYSDVLGRSVKTELLNWEGGSVYSATVNTYNARDQITSTKEYSGPEAAGNTFRETTQSYDGFGRLQTKHLPQESAGTGTTWTYNADDTVNTITDARGAVSTYGYVGTARGLVKTIAHTLTGKPTINVSFSYDGAGNRISMTDPNGTSNYGYDQLSQLTSESRTLAGTTYTLNYQYTVSGQLKKMTYPGNISVNYGYDSVGRLTGVTGSDTLYQNVSQYASNFTYRAFGGRKTMTDGASRTSTITYDSRLRPASYQISGAVVSQTYDYYNDGTLHFVHNTSDNNFDRSYEYDHAGRVTFATTGGSARGDLGAVPYFETVGYNAWSDTTSRFTETWAQDDFSDVGTFTNGRRDGWAYEADGNIKTIDTRNYAYDAAGHRNSITGQLWGGSSYFPTSTTNAFDGDDKKVEEVLSFPSTFTSKYLRSSVVGGQIAQEINSAGQTIIYVYLPDGTLLSTLVGFPKWKNAVPAGTGLYETYQSGFVNRVEFDPFKANVGLTAPPPPDTNGGDGDIGGNHNGGPTDSRFSDMSNPAAGCFDVEGVVLPCTWSVFDVLEVFVWGPARNPSANTRTDTAVWVPPKRVVPVNIPNPFTKFLTGEDTDTATVSTTYIPGHWVNALAPFVRVNFQPSPQNSVRQDFAHPKSPCPPTGKELANKATVKKALAEARKLSQSTRVERGGWIFWNKTNGKISYYIKDPPTVNPLHPKDGDTYFQVYLNNPPTPPKGSVIIGTFHTHPENVGADDWDIGNENARRVPGIVATPDGKANPYGPNRGIWYSDLPSYCK